MLSLSPEAKEAYAKYVGPDGKLIIDDTVPENLRETFQFFNDNNINILELNMERIYNDSLEESSVESDDDVESDFADDSDTSDDLEIEDGTFNEDSDVDLDDMFSDL